MRTVYTLIIISFIITCSSKRNQENQAIGETGSQAISTQAKELRPSNSAHTWGKLQDSLRAELLNVKPNENLKSSLLQELYIRGLVSQENNKYKFLLPFNLHGFDCGAPDCYSTDITFEFSATNPISFPKEILFKLFEHGCVDIEICKAGIFELEEETSEYVNYYSKTERSNLLIFGTDERKEFVYYFSEVKPDSIKGKLIGELLDNYNEEDPETIAPYRITTMLFGDYEVFF